MKFSFKIQQYQTDAVVRVFRGQPYNVGVSYLRDMGSLPLGRCSLDIEMETGTGKTYVYIKTIIL